MSQVRPSIFLLLVLSLLAVGIPANVIQIGDEIYDPSEISAIVEPLIRQARAPQQATATVTVLRTTTLSSVTTTVVTTKRTCGVLGSAPTVNPGGILSLTSTASVACRRRRQYWNEPVFIGLKNDDTSVQYYRLSPSQVLNFEPTMIAQFRNTNNPNVQLVKESPAAVEPSFEKVPTNVRVAQPVFGSSLNSLISSIVASILTSTTTTTSTVTAYTSTSASTTYTATASYFVIGACYPAGLVTC